MKLIETGTAAKLLAFAKAAFLIRSAMTGPQGYSKRHPLGERETGPEAADHYRHSRNISRSHGSSLKKLDRAARIHNGERPRKYDVPGKREATILRRAEAREKAAG